MNTMFRASRRTDLPAFHFEWFMNRISPGWRRVPDRLNDRQVSFVWPEPDELTGGWRPSLMV